MTAKITTARRRAGFGRFLGYYTLANAGAHIAFIPLLILVMPIKIERIAGDDKLTLLSVALLIGAVVASIANIAAGIGSDWLYRRYGSRKGQIVCGLLLVTLSYYVFYRAGTRADLIGAIIFFQASFNIMFSPLTTLLADQVPDHQKGMAAALLNLATPIGNFFIIFLTLRAFEGEAARLGLTLAVALITFVPLLAIAGHGRATSAQKPDTTAPIVVYHSRRNDFICAWTGRLFLQISGAVMFGYLYYILSDVVRYTQISAGAAPDSGIGFLNLIATPATIIISIAAGRWSDALRVRKPFLVVSALTTGAAIFTISQVPSWPVIVTAYACVVAGLTVFLGIDNALVTQLLSGEERRAQKLGYMNLTNTLPAIIAPSTALLLHSNTIEAETLIRLMQLACILAVVAAIVVTRIRTIA